MSSLAQLFSQQTGRAPSFSELTSLSGGQNLYTTNLGSNLVDNNNNIITGTQYATPKGIFNSDYGNTPLAGGQTINQGILGQTGLNLSQQGLGSIFNQTSVNREGSNYQGTAQANNNYMYDPNFWSFLQNKFGWVS